MSRGISNITKPSMDRNPADLERYARQTNDWGSRLPFAGMAFQVWRSTNQPLNGAAYATTILVPDTAIYDTDGFFNEVTGVVSIPANCGGWYTFTLDGYIGTTQPGFWVLQKNGIAVARLSNPQGTNPNSAMVTSHISLCQPGDVITLGFCQEAAYGGNMISLAAVATNGYLCSFSGLRVALQ